METNTTSIPKGSLSTADLDVLAGMAIVFMHCADKCVQMIENQYALDYMAGKYFKDLCKKYGRVQATAIVKDQCGKVVRGEEMYNISNVLKAAKAFFAQMSKVTNLGLTAHHDDVSGVRSFDDLMDDVNYLCGLYGMICNVNTNDANKRLKSFIQSLIDENDCKRVSDVLMEKLTQ